MKAMIRLIEVDRANFSVIIAETTDMHRAKIVCPIVTNHILKCIIKKKRKKEVYF